MTKQANRYLRLFAYFTVFGRRGAYPILKPNMRRNVFEVLFVLLSLVCGNRCFAQAEPPANVPGPSTTSPSTTAHNGKPGEEILGDTVYIYPASPDYPAELASQGAQGLVILLLDLTPDGHVKAARVHTSSHAEGLDAAAMRRASSMTYQGRGTPPSTVSLRVEFRRDSVASLQTKTCADFNMDIDWFRRTFPGRPESDMAALQITMNLVMLNVGTWHHEHRDPVLRALPAALDATVQGCKEFPGENFKDMFNRALTTASEAGVQTSPSKDKVEPTPACATTNSCTNAAAVLPRSILWTTLDKPIWMREQYVTPDMAAYPAELVSAGIQGMVLLQVNLTAQGEISNINVQHNQSGDKALADAAVAYANKLPFKQFARSDPTPIFVSVLVEFDKDTQASITTKTCADFDIDADAWLSAHPKSDVQSMHVFGVSTGLITRLAFEQALDFEMPLPPHLGLGKNVAAVCRANPQLLFMDVLKQQLRLIAAGK